MLTWILLAVNVNGALHLKMRGVKIDQFWT